MHDMQRKQLGPLSVVSWEVDGSEFQYEEWMDLVPAIKNAESGDLDTHCSKINV